MDLNKNLIQLGTRVYNSKSTTMEADEKVIIELVGKAFNSSNNSIDNYQAYRDLNQLIVLTADTLQKPNNQQTINLVTDYKKVNVNDIAKYSVDDKLTRVSTALTATGAGVNFTKIPTSRKVVFATPIKHQFGVKYSISEMISDPINKFREAVNLVNEEKTRYILSQIYVLTREASANSKIPSRQKSEGASLEFSKFKSIESSLLRYGRNVKPVMVADTLFINSLAEKQATELIKGSTTPLYLTEDLKNSLLRDATIEQISKTLAISIDNPYTDNMNSKVDLPVNEAIMVAGGSASPFKITEFGTMAVLSDTVQEHLETEDAYMKISYTVDITLLLNRAIGYIKDTSVVL